MYVIFFSSKTTAPYSFRFSENYGNKLFLKPKYFKKQRFSSFAFWVLHGHFEPVYLLQVSKMMMKNVASWNNLTLELKTRVRVNWECKFNTIY